MSQRFNYIQHTRSAFQSLSQIETFLHASSLGPALVDLVKLRVSQINGCAYCIDMHWKDLRAREEPEQRLYGLDAWHEAPYYTPRERAALRWAEAITTLSSGHVANDVYADVSTHFDEAELSVLTMAVSAINAWNRLAIASRQTPGAYVSRVTK